MDRKRFVPLTVGVALVIVVVAVGTFVLSRAAQPTYQTVGEGIALGPAARHTPAPTDVLVQIATGALSTAAGSAGGVVPTIGDSTPTAAEQQLLDMTNADRAQNGLPPVAFDPCSSQDPTTVAQLNNALMNSPTHRANILEPTFNLLAVGAAAGPDGRLALAEIFRDSAEQ